MLHTMLVPFATWQEVLAYAQAGGVLFYHAPLDVRPCPLAAHRKGPPCDYTYLARARTIRIWPPGSVGRGRRRTSDPFTADAGHLDRFKRPAIDGTAAVTL